jgi:hypothetical protein
MGRLIPPNPKWNGPRHQCSMCKASLPLVRVEPKAPGAVAVYGSFCPVCDRQTKEDREKRGGR